MFNSITLYQCTQANAAILRAIEEGIPKRPFASCKEKEAAASGWVPPLGPGTDTMSYSAEGATLFCLRTDTKSVPASAVKLLVADRVATFEKETGETCSAVDRRVFKEEITESLLPGAVPAPSWTYAYLDTKLSMLIVGGGEEDADNFIAVLRKTLDSTPVKLLGLPDVEPCDKFTDWLKDPAEHLGDAFDLGDSCSLKQAKEGGTAVINISHEELECEDIGAMLEAGKQCCRIALQHEVATFAVNARLGLRRFKLVDSYDEDEGDDPVDNTAGQFVEIVRAVRDVLQDLEPLLGGFPMQELLDLHDEQAEVAA